MHLTQPEVPVVIFVQALSIDTNAEEINIFDVQATVYREKILIIKPTRCTKF